MKLIITTIMLATSLLATPIQPRHPRPVYSNSIIPGGATPIAVLALRFGKNPDPIVVEAFKNFGDELGLVVNDRDLHVHVAYRLGNRVVYTKGLKLIPKGELLIADAAGHLARARCGNVLKVFVPPAQVTPPAAPEPDIDAMVPPAAPEPDIDAMVPPDTAVDIPDYSPELSEYPTAPRTPMPDVPEQWGSVTPILPFSFVPSSPVLFVPSTPLYPTPTPTPNPVPEPGSGYLVLIGVVLAALVWAVTNVLAEAHKLERFLALNLNREEEQTDVADTEIR